MDFIGSWEEAAPRVKGAGEISPKGLQQGNSFAGSQLLPCLTADKKSMKGASTLKSRLADSLNFSSALPALRLVCHAAFPQNDGRSCDHRDRDHEW
jgi:hypothetical protein